MRNATHVGRALGRSAAAVLGLTVLTACADRIAPLASSPDYLDLPHAQETVLPDGRLEIVPIRGFDGSKITDQVARHEETIDGVKTVTYSRNGTALTVLMGRKDRAEASMLVTPDGSVTYKLNGIEQGRLERGSVSGSPAERGRFLKELRTRRAAPGAGLRLDESTNCPTCIIEPPTEGGANADMRFAYTKHIGNLNTLSEYTKDRDPDGCSSSPDGWWKECCDMHDFAYQDGGALEAERQDADVMLYDCMVRRGAANEASIYYTAVRNFGDGAFNWRDSYYTCLFQGSRGLWVYGPGRYINNPWGYSYWLGTYPYSDDCRSKGYN